MKMRITSLFILVLFFVSGCPRRPHNYELVLSDNEVRFDNDANNNLLICADDSCELSYWIDLTSSNWASYWSRKPKGYVIIDFSYINRSFENLSFDMNSFEFESSSLSILSWEFEEINDSNDLKNGLVQLPKGEGLFYFKKRILVQVKDKSDGLDTIRIKPMQFYEGKQVRYTTPEFIYIVKAKSS